MRYQPVPIVLVCAAAIGAPGVVVTNAFAADYMTAAEAQKSIFPDATSFEPVALALSVDQLKQLADLPRNCARHGLLRTS